MNQSEIKLIISSDGSVSIEQLGKVQGKLRELDTGFAGAATAIKGHWLAISAAIVGGVMAVNRAIDFLRIGAMAVQAEDAFRRTADSYNINADRMIADMKRVTAHTIDDSDLMQKAMKGLTAGLSEQTVVQIAQASRIAARRMGMDVSEAYNMVADAVETNRVRALRNFGLITPAQAKWIEQIQQTGKELDVMKIIMTNVNAQTQLMGGHIDTAAEKLQRFRAGVKESQEGLSKFLLKLAEFAIPENPSGKPVLPGLNVSRDAYSRSPSLAGVGTGPYVGVAQDALDAQKKMNEQLARDAKNMGKVLDDLKPRMDEYRRSIEQLNPWLTEYDKRLIDITGRSEKLIAAYKEKKALTAGIKAEVEAERERGMAYVRQAEQIKLLETAEKTAADWAKSRHAWETAAAEQKRSMFDIEAGHAQRMASYEPASAAAVRVRYDWERRSLELKLEQVAAENSLGEGEEANIRMGGQLAAVMQQISNLRLYEAHDIMRLEIEQEQKLLQLAQQRADTVAQTRAQILSSLTGGQYAEGLAPGLSLMQQGVAGMMATQQGQDPYALQLAQLKNYWQQVINEYATGAATIQQLDAARVSYTQALAQQEAMTKVQYAQFAAQATLGILTMVYTATGQKSKEIFYIMKAVQVANATIDAFRAYTHALAMIPPPANIPFAKMVLGLGLAGAAAIAATAFMGAPGAAGAGAGAAGVGTYAQPAVVTPAEPAAQTKMYTPEVHIHVYGNVVDHDKFARELVGPLQKALNDGAH